MTKLSARLEALAEKAARLLTNKHILRAVDEMQRNPQNWQIEPCGEVRCREPYPMSFMPRVTRGHNARFYYAIGWGFSTGIAFWERWLLRKASEALKAKDLS